MSLDKFRRIDSLSDMSLVYYIGMNVDASGKTILHIVNEGPNIILGISEAASTATIYTLENQTPGAYEFFKTALSYAGKYLFVSRTTYDFSSVEIFGTTNNDVANLDFSNGCM